MLRVTFWHLTREDQAIQLRKIPRETRLAYRYDENTDYCRMQHWRLDRADHYRPADSARLDLRGEASRFMS